MTRANAKIGWLGTAAVYSVSSLVGGAASGAILGTAGGLVPAPARVACAALFCLGAATVAALELTGRRVPVLQCNRETPRTWVDTGPLKWAMLNGLALGCGAASRIGFPLWYAVPAAAFLGGSTELGTAVYALYGGVRGAGVWFIMFGLSRWVRPSRDVGRWLNRQSRPAHALAAAYLLLTGVSLSVLVGFW